jgi:hypothetical protein
MRLLQRITAKLSIIRELISFLWARKLWWMIPIIIFLLLISLLLIFAQGSALGPFIYTLF